MWCSAADTQLKIQDHAVSGAGFLTVGVLECGIAHRRSVTVLCMLYKIRCDPVHPLNGAIPGSFVPVRVTSGALVAHRYYAPPRCRTSKYRRIFILLTMSLWTILLTLYVFDGVGLAGFKRRANTFLLA